MDIAQDGSPRAIIIVGAGGAGVEAVWVAREMNEARTAHWDIAGFADDNPKLWESEIDGIPVIGGTSALADQFPPTKYWMHVAIGSNKQRRRTAERLGAIGYRFASLIHPTAVIAATASVEDGVMVGPYSVLAPYARVRSHALINSFVGVGHHAEICMFAQLCPGVRLSGHAQVCEGAFIGSNAVILPRVVIGEGAILGASSLAIRSVAPLHSVMGVPARILSKPATAGPTAR